MHQCIEPNQESRLNFAGPVYDSQNKEIYILVCIDRISKYQTAKIVSNPNAPNVERSLLKYFGLHGVPRQIRLDQVRCLIGNAVETLCEISNVEIKAAPEEKHRVIGLVERLVGTLKND